MNELMIGIILISLLWLPLSSEAQSDLREMGAVKVMLAKNWQDVEFNYQQLNQQITYYVSEKYDGVRAIYQQGEFKTRAGNIIEVPDFIKKAFTENIKSQSIEGEFWLGRNQFDELSGLIRSNNVLDSRWQKVQFRVFDAPSIQGNFIDRKIWFEQAVDKMNHPQIQSAGHQLVQHQQHLEDFYQTKLAQGAEGIMLINAFSVYQQNRSEDLIKRKPLMDAEAKVVGYTKGKGKYEGLMGALVVQDESGRTFKIGTGFSMLERKTPPAIGETITFAFNGLTKNGLPRFARFVRVWQES